MNSLERMKTAVLERGFSINRLDSVTDSGKTGIWMIKGDGNYCASDPCLERLLQKVITDRNGQFPSLRKPCASPFISPEFSDRLAHVVDVLGWTREQLSDAAQIPESQLEVYLQATEHPSEAAVEKIAAALMVSPAWLGFGVGPVIVDLLQ